MYCGFIIFLFWELKLVSRVSSQYGKPWMFYEQKKNSVFIIVYTILGVCVTLFGSPLLRGNYSECYKYMTVVGDVAADNNSPIQKHLRN